MGTLLVESCWWKIQVVYNGLAKTHPPISFVILHCVATRSGYCVGTLYALILADTVLEKILLILVLLVYTEAEIYLFYTG